MASTQQAVGVPRPGEDPAAEHLLDVAAAAEGQHVGYRDGHQAAAGNNGEGWSFFLATLVGFGFLTFNSGMAIARSAGDKAAIAFVGFSYADLVLLFVCLRMYERAPAGSSRRDWLKVAVWILTTLLTLAFSSKVAAIMPPAVAVVVWVMAFATIAGGFVCFFVYKERK